MRCMEYLYIAMMTNSILFHPELGRSRERICLHRCSYLLIVLQSLRFDQPRTLYSHSQVHHILLLSAYAKSHQVGCEQHHQPSLMLTCCQLCHMSYYYYILSLKLNCSHICIWTNRQILTVSVAPLPKHNDSLFLRE